ncbi:MAG TPA: hypothetical protein VEZ15_02950, partial [Acidimicrobiia bacterium]|nr:hypothetical protein [Acidimicrobiia bacterium]
MTRLAVRLALRGGRSGLVRVGLIAIALAAGSAMLIVGSWVLTAGVARNDRVETRRGLPLASVDMLLHRAQGVPLNSVTSGRPFVIWSKTSLSAPRARTITAFGIAPSGTDAPRPPGVRAIPKPGTALASPALRALVDSREGGS